MNAAAAVRRVVILGAAGRDFHDFNTVFRDDPGCRVVAFTATQIPDIAGRRYPPELAGPGYPDGIPVLDAADLPGILARERIDEVVFAYSDVAHATVMHQASLALAAGADFTLLGPARTMLRSRLPVIAVSAVRTGCGKSQVARWLARRLRARGLTPAVLRHPMPYGDLARQAVQRFASLADLDAAACTVEEREEYEPHLATGSLVFAGVDYAAILARAEGEADVILWDGGNNDFPFVRPDLHLVLVDPLRPGHATSHHPGEAVLRMADVVVVAKCDSAEPAAIDAVTTAARAANPHAVLVHGGSPVTLDEAQAVAGKRALVVEDGPTLTHGGMPWGAGYVAASPIATLVDPRASAHPAIAAVYRDYPHIGPVLPAVGYSPAQLAALAATINASAAEVVVLATPCDLARLVRIDKPVVRARYEFADRDRPGLGALVDEFVASGRGREQPR
ncbi:MAG: GTPase [Gammaproteobacteria bacterium]|nr:GTPase [Gammaproteobacteria bacterium]